MITLVSSVPPLLLAWCLTVPLTSPPLSIQTLSSLNHSHRIALVIIPNPFNTRLGCRKAEVFFILTILSFSFFFSSSLLLLPSFIFNEYAALGKARDPPLPLDPPLPPNRHLSSPHRAI